MTFKVKSKALEPGEGILSSFLQKQIPESWTEENKHYTELDEAEKKARRSYRSNVDQAYETIAELRGVLNSAEDLAAVEPQLAALQTAIAGESA